MSDTGKGAPANETPKSIHAGMQIPLFKVGKSKPSAWSADDMNVIVRFLNAVSKMKVVIDNAQPDASGNFNPTGEFVVSEHNSILHLTLSPGQLSTSGTTIYYDTFAESFANYIITTGNVRVGKWPTLYCSASRIEYGKTINYTYPHNVAPGFVSDALYGQYRTAAITSTPNENQGVNPEWVSGDAIFFVGYNTGLSVELNDAEQNDVVNYPMSATGVYPCTAGAAIVYQDLNCGARAWAQFYDQLY